MDKELRQLERAGDPVLKAQGGVFASAESADGKGNDSATAVRHYVKWCWYAGYEAVSRLEAWVRDGLPRGTAKDLDTGTSLLGEQ